MAIETDGRRAAVWAILEAARLTHTWVSFREMALMLGVTSRQARHAVETLGVPCEVKAARGRRLARAGIRPVLAWMLAAEVHDADGLAHLAAFARDVIRREQLRERDDLAARGLDSGPPA